MRVTPRRTEVSAIIEILESEGYDSDEAMAKALLKKCAQILSMRDTFCLVLQSSAKPLNFGPYASAKDAEKMGVKLLGAGTGICIVKVNASGVLAGRDDKAYWTGFCTCGHFKESHKADGASRGKCLSCDDGDCGRFKERK